MQVSFGNLTYPHHNDNHEDSEAMVKEMMDKLNAAGFTRVENTEAASKGTKNYHIYDLPHKIEFSSNADEAVEIMRPYSKYMKPLQVIA